MTWISQTRLVFALSFVLFVVMACGSAAPSPQAPFATADTDEIASIVLAEVESQLTQQAAIAKPGADTDEITAAVLAEVEARLAQADASSEPTLDASAIAATVLAEVEEKLAQQSEVVPALYDGAVAAAGAADLQAALIKLYQRANPAVVYIVIPSVGSGSGFVYSLDGHIVTNNHVVEDARSYEVVFANGERQLAELVGADAHSDLAVIKVDQLPSGVEPLPLAEADSLWVGQFVVAIGNPFGEQGSMSLGIVSGLDRSLRSQQDSTFGGGYSLPEVIQTDAPINPGNSGGPLLNLLGEVVGVNSAIASTTGTNSGVGFSIPVAAVRQIAPGLVKRGKYEYPYLGASFDDEITLDEQSALGLSRIQGAYVVGVTAGGPADDAGLIPANRTSGRGGDLIVKLDNQEIVDFSDLNGYLVFHTTVGQTIEVTVLRDGELVALPLVLGERP